MPRYLSQKYCLWRWTSSLNLPHCFSVGAGSSVALVLFKLPRSILSTGVGGRGRSPFITTIAMAFYEYGTGSNVSICLQSFEQLRRWLEVLLLVPPLTFSSCSTLNFHEFSISSGPLTCFAPKKSGKLTKATGSVTQRSHGMMTPPPRRRWQWDCGLLRCALWSLAAWNPNAVWKRQTGIICAHLTRVNLFLFLHVLDCFKFRFVISKTFNIWANILHQLEDLQALLASLVSTAHLRPVLPPSRGHRTSPVMSLWFNVI